jgi:chromate transporter
MNMGVLYDLVAFFGGLSLLSFGGGNAVVPEIQRHVVLVTNWLSDAEFVALYAISQSAPGPSSLFVAQIGWRIAGWPGAIAATLAMYTPSSILVYLAERSRQRFRDQRWLARLEIGLAPITIGLIFSGGWIVAQEVGKDWIGWLIAAGMAFFVVTTKLNPLPLVLVAGVIGAIAWS